MQNLELAFDTTLDNMPLTKAQRNELETSFYKLMNLAKELNDQIDHIGDTTKMVTGNKPEEIHDDVLCIKCLITCNRTQFACTCGCLCECHLKFTELPN